MDKNFAQIQDGDIVEFKPDSAYYRPGYWRVDLDGAVGATSKKPWIGHLHDNSGWYVEASELQTVLSRDDYDTTSLKTDADVTRALEEMGESVKHLAALAKQVLDEVRQPRRTSSTPAVSPPETEIPAPNPKMSPEEVEKLITDNIKLAYWFANQWSNIPGVNKEDIESQAIHGLVKAANTYDPAKGSFAGYASQVIRNYLGHLHFHQGEKTAMEPASLDAPLGGDDEGEDSSMHDKYGDPKAKGSELTTARAEATRIINDEIERIPEPDRSMVKRWMNGESYRDMQKDFNLSFMQIRNRVNAAMANVKSNLAAKGILGLQDIWPESMADDMDGKLILDCLMAQIEVSLALKNLQERNTKDQLEKI